MDLIALVIQLRAVNTVDSIGFTGHKVQAWFLDQIRQQVGFEHSELLHLANQKRAFTVSPVMESDHVSTRIQRSRSYWFRITALKSVLSETVAELCSGWQDRPIDIVPGQFVIASCSHDARSHPWAGERAWRGLSPTPSPSESRSSLDLQFVTPTMFGAGGIDYVLPEPKRLFFSWWQHLNELNLLSGEDVETRPGLFADHYAIVTDCDLHTQHIAYRYDGREVHVAGSVGEMQMRFARYSPESKITPEEYEHEIRVLRALYELSFYFGTGHHTARGFGLTRPVEPIDS